MPMPWGHVALKRKIKQLAANGQNFQGDFGFFPQISVIFTGRFIRFAAVTVPLMMRDDRV